MVVEISKRRMKLFQCEICKFNYAEKTMAEKCEDWCRKHNSCNLEITKNAYK